MKRFVVGTLLLSIVMFVQLFGNIPVFADTFVPTSSYDFTSLADLGYALIGGAEFDFEGSPYVIDNYNSLSSEQKEIQKSLAARAFLKDYMESRGIAFEEDGELHPGSAYYTIAFGLAGQEFFEAFQTASSSDQEDMTYSMPISPSRFADWAQYNKYWFNRYADSFAQEGESSPAAPPDEYSILNNTKTFDWYLGADFYSDSYSVSGLGVSSGWTNSLSKDVTFTLMNYQSDSFANLQSNIVPSSVMSLFISDVNNIVTMSYSGFAYSWAPNPNNTSAYLRYISNRTISVNDLRFTRYDWANNNTPSFRTTFTNMLDCVNYISNSFRHVNIYYNGTPWLEVSDSAPANPTIPDFPDIINQESGELAYDISMPKTQDYSGSFDLTSLFDAIREGIAGASDGDLATGSTIGSLDVGRTYTGEGIDIQDRVIDLTSSRVFDGTLTDDTTGRLPKPPVVPPAVSAGLGGVTVLAKYVDATQCILPEDLITAFWGCVWILIILGLIKNLHR